MFSFASPIVLRGLADYGSSRAPWVKGGRVRESRNTGSVLLSGTPPVLSGSSKNSP